MTYSGKHPIHNRENAVKLNTLKTAVRIAFWSGMAAGVAAPMLAQAQAKKEEPSTVETITVTGSSIPTTPSEAAVPVTVLGVKEIEATGVNSNALELLRKAVPSFAGRSNTGNSNANNNNQNTAGGSQIQLRNLDTLVLVNGRRMPTSGINAIGGKNFVDINQIPVAAIERIEVLTDGASSIYGSDAIGGVVNLILKSEYEGSEVGGRYGYAPHPEDAILERTMRSKGGTFLLCYRVLTLSQSVPFAGRSTEQECSVLTLACHDGTCPASSTVFRSVSTQID